MIGYFFFVYLLTSPAIGALTVDYHAPLNRAALAQTSKERADQGTHCVEEFCFRIGHQVRGRHRSNYTAQDAPFASQPCAASTQTACPARPTPPCGRDAAQTDELVALQEVLAMVQSIGIILSELWGTPALDHAGNPPWPAEQPPPWSYSSPPWEDRPWADTQWPNQRTKFPHGRHRSPCRDRRGAEKRASRRAK